MTWQVIYFTLLDDNIFLKRKIHHSAVHTQNYSKQHSMCLNEFDLIGFVY